MQLNIFDVIIYHLNEVNVSIVIEHMFEVLNVWRLMR